MQSARRMMRHPAVVAAVAIGTLDATSAAVIDLLAPLRLGERDVASWAIGAALVASGIAGMLFAPIAGRISDRVGHLRVALAAGIGLLVVTLIYVFPLPSWAMLALLVPSGRCSPRWPRRSSRSPPAGRTRRGSGTAPRTPCSASGGRSAS